MQFSQIHAPTSESNEDNWGRSCPNNKSIHNFPPKKFVKCKNLKQKSCNICLTYQICPKCYKGARETLIFIGASISIWQFLKWKLEVSSAFVALSSFLVSWIYIFVLFLWLCFFYCLRGIDGRAGVCFMFRFWLVFFLFLGEVLIFWFSISSFWFVFWARRHVIHTIFIYIFVS